MNKRILREIKDISKCKDENFSLRHNQSDIQKWWILIKGLTGTPYESGFFELEMILPDHYPHVPPKVHFKTGEICLDVLKQNWTPAWTMLTIVRAIIALLNTPESSSPLNCDAGNLLRLKDFRGYNSLAKMYSKLFAKYEKVKYCV